MGFISGRHYNRFGMTTANNGVVIGPIDISRFSKYSVVYQNNNTAITFLNMLVEVAMDASGSEADQALNWGLVNTATLPQPSALGATAAVFTTSVDNCFNWLRVRANVCQTAAINTFSLFIGGFTG